MNKYERQGIVASPIFPDSREFTNEVLNAFGPAPTDPHAARNTGIAVLSGILVGRAMSRRGRRA